MIHSKLTRRISLTSLTLIFSLSLPLTAMGKSTVENLTKSTLMQKITSTLRQGIHVGRSDDNESCILVINNKSGQEKFSLKAYSDDYDLRLLFDENLSSILFKVETSAEQMSILQDFSDSYAEVKISKENRKTRVTIKEFISSEEQRIQSCTF